MPLVWRWCTILCVRALSLDTFPLDVERALDKIHLKKPVRLATIRDRGRLMGGALTLLCRLGISGERCPRLRIPRTTLRGQLR